MHKSAVSVVLVRYEVSLDGKMYCKVCLKVCRTCSINSGSLLRKDAKILPVLIHCMSSSLQVKNQTGEISAP